jgi:hypothetical protein
MLHQLPRAVEELARRLCAATEPVEATVRLAQTGRMRQDASAPWRRFRARQTISTSTCRFDWRARTGPGGLVRVREALIDGHGRAQVRALGLVPIARVQGSPALTRGEFMRYMAELPWAPDAILRNPHLHWHETAPRKLVVSTAVGKAAADVLFELDSDGRIASAFAADRPRAVGQTFVPTPWRGRFFDYRLHQGRWLPFRGEVGWVVGGVEQICWQGVIERWTATAVR